MKQVSFITKCFVCVSVVACALFFAGCSKDEVDYSGHPIIGEWGYYSVSTYNLYYLTFETNGNVKQRWIPINSPKEASENSYNYRIENNILKGSLLLVSGINHYMTFSRDLDTLFLGKNEYRLLRVGE